MKRTSISLLPTALLPAALLALSCFSAPAFAQTYDLRKLAERDVEVGETVVDVVNDDRDMRMVVTQDGAVVQDTGGKTGHLHRRVRSLLSPSSQLLRYESFKDLATGADLEVKGLEIELSKGAEGKWTFKAKGNQAIPPALSRALDKEYLEKSDEALAKKKKQWHGLLPAKPVAIGGTWTVNVDEITKNMFPGSVLGEAGSSGKGVLKSKQGSLVHLEVETTLVFDTFDGTKCSKPMVIKLEIALSVSADGSSPLGGGTMKMSMEGTMVAPDAPHGVEMALVLTGKTSETRQAHSK